jgi:hypothetical protein
MATDRLAVVNRAVERLRVDVVGHPLAGSLVDQASLRTFMEHHVWAVWDFMWLLGELRMRFTASAPWVPPENSVAARLVNEITLAEESDESPLGYSSHLEWYLAAMTEVAADSTSIELAVGKVRAATGYAEAVLEHASPAARRFNAVTLQFLRASTPELVGAFCFGREALIPAMFEPLAEGQGGLFEAYLRRHIEIDERHGVLAGVLCTSVCGEDPVAWLGLIAAARRSLWARRRLWDDIDHLIKEQR